MVENGIVKEIEDKDLKGKISTDPTNPNIAVKENVLESGKNYILRVGAWETGAPDSKYLLYLFVCFLLFVIWYF